MVHQRKNSEARKRKRTGTLWQKFHNLCIFLPRHHKIVRQPKKTNEVWKYGIFYVFSFILLLMYRTIILKILLFVVCAVVFLLRVMSVYVLWIFHNFWQIRILHYRTLRYFLIKYWWNQTYVWHRTVWKNTTLNVIKTKIVKKSVFEFSLF